MRPRTRSCLSIRPSSSSRAVISPMVCAVRPVRRASSALGRLPLQANGLQHHPLVELAHAHLVGAARAQQGAGWQPAGQGGVGSWTQIFADDTLAQDEVAKGLHLARQHDGVGGADALVEGKALHRLGTLTRQQFGLR